MSEKIKWECNCQDYLKKELKKIEPWQTNAKKLIEELLASVECPYKTLDRKKNENFRCNLDPAKSPELDEAGRYTLCDCGETIRNNKPWVDKSGEFWAKDDGWENHVKNCSKYQSSPNRERERERDNILTYFKSNNIKSIELDNNNLIITYNNGKTETNQAKTQQLSQIKSYLQTQPNKKITQNELNNQTSQPNKPNYLPWILGGVGIISLIGIITYFLTRKKPTE